MLKSEKRIVDKRGEGFFFMFLGIKRVGWWKISQRV